MTLHLRPVFCIQYNERSVPIEKPVVMSCMPFVVDGLFNTTRLTRFSLGCCVNPDRTAESRRSLANLGLGLEFCMGINLGTDNNVFYVKSSTSNQDVYIMLKKSKEQIVVTSGETKPIFDLTTLFAARVVPKKLAKLYDEYTFKISFGRPFIYDENNNEETPSWIQMNLIRLVD